MAAGWNGLSLKTYNFVSSSQEDAASLNGLSLDWLGTYLLAICIKRELKYSNTVLFFDNAIID